MESLNLCRICLSQEDMEEAFDSVFIDEVATKIFNLSGVQLIEGEDEPSLICHECSSNLNIADELRNKCLNADKFFRKSSSFKPQIKSSHVDDDQISIIDEEETYLEPSDANEQEGRRKRVEDKIITQPRTTQQLKPVTSLCSAKISNSSDCTECLKTFSNPSYLKKHKYFCHSVIPVEDLFVCDFCGLRTKTKQLIRNHITVAHSTRPKEKFICKICGKFLSTKGNLESHEKTHNIIDPSKFIPCTVCKKTFREKRFMVEHFKLVHEKSKAFQCPHCPHISTCKGAYNTHFKSVHLKARDHICPDCGLGFSANSQLTRHYRIHTGERPFECRSCAKAFRLSSHRKRHEDICVKRIKVINHETS